MIYECHRNRVTRRAFLGVSGLVGIWAVGAADPVEAAPPGELQTGYGTQQFGVSGYDN